MNPVMSEVRSQVADGSYTSAKKELNERVFGLIGDKTWVPNRVWLEVVRQLTREVDAGWIP